MGVNSWALMDDAFSMDGIMPSLWGYQETIDELQQKLLYATEELKSFQMNANENIRKQAEYIDRLLQFLKITCQERDEARNQLHLLLKKLVPLDHSPPEIPPAVPANNNSGIVESDSVSVESFFDTVTSPELSNINMADSCHVVAGYNPGHGVGASAGAPRYDQAYARIEQIVTKKPLPEKGKLVAAVMDAGPLLQTLMIAGPLPQWRNPPKLQPLLVPPVSINDAVSKSAAVVGPSILPQMHAGISGLCAMKRGAIGSYQSSSMKRQKTN